MLKAIMAAVGSLRFTRPTHGDVATLLIRCADNDKRRKIAPPIRQTNYIQF
jgi:hypothetical protein